MCGPQHTGLFFSSDAGDSWQRAAGVISQVQTAALGYGVVDGHTILYAATNGGEAKTGGKVRLSVQRLRNGHWLTVNRLARTISTSGTYRPTYRPARRGSYRMRATIAKAATNTPAKTTWRTFKVR